MSCLVVLRFSQNSFHSSDLFRRFGRLHSSVLAGRYFEAPDLGTSDYIMPSKNSIGLLSSVRVTIAFFQLLV